MASSKSTINQPPSVLLFKLVDGMELQVIVSGFSSGHNAKMDIQHKNCSRAWILHWGCNYHGRWVFPADFPPGDAIYKQVVLQTPFIKRGDVVVIVIELRDPTMHAVEFVLKDGRYDKWLKLNQGNFQIPLPKHETSKSIPPVPKDFIEQKAFLIWESKGRPLSSPTQQKKNYDDALRKLQDLLSKGMSLNELQNHSRTAAVYTKVVSNKEKQGSDSFRRRHDVINWLHKRTKVDMKKSTSPCLALTDVKYNKSSKSLYLGKKSITALVHGRGGVIYLKESVEHTTQLLFDLRCVTMDEEEEVVLDYSSDPMVVNKAFRASLFSRIAEAGKIIEGLFGYAQDIEGVVKDEQVHVQSRPQI